MERKKTMKARNSILVLIMILLVAFPVSAQEGEEIDLFGFDRLLGVLVPVPGEDVSNAYAFDAEEGEWCRTLVNKQAEVVREAGCSAVFTQEVEHIYLLIELNGSQLDPSKIPPPTPGLLEEADLGTFVFTFEGVPGKFDLLLLGVTLFDFSVVVGQDVGDVVMGAWSIVVDGKLFDTFFIAYSYEQIEAALIEGELLDPPQPAGASKGNTLA